MIETTRLLLFFSAAVILAITPGPGLFYVLARSVAGGRREGIMSSLGTFAGGLVHVVAAALGISAVLATSALVFDVVRYAGAAYLVYLGTMMILSRDAEPAVDLGVRRSPVVQGVITEVLNPKTALFFLSFIPQFVSVGSGHVVAQFIKLGCISVALNTGADLIVAIFAGPVGARFQAHATFRRRQRALSGAGMIGLGIYVAAADSR